jgi:hypothetical protein
MNASFVASFKRWIAQPTTIHGLGALALGIVGYTAHTFGADPKIAVACGAVGYVLTHLGINDNSASQNVQKLLEDAATAYVNKQLATALPTLLTDGSNIAVAFGNPTPIASVNAPVVPATPIFGNPNNA